MRSAAGCGVFASDRWRRDGCREVVPGRHRSRHDGRTVAALLHPGRRPLPCDARVRHGADRQAQSSRGSAISRVDLISCRNVLIYLDREVQRQVCATFHFALHSYGDLCLGA